MQSSSCLQSTVLLVSSSLSYLWIFKFFLIPNIYKLFCKMKVVLCLFACLSVALAFPQEGAQFANEAIKQAQTSHLIPQDAIIQNVEKSVPLAAYENIPAGQNFDLFMVLGDQVPREVIANLQQQIQNINRRR